MKSVVAACFMLLTVALSAQRVEGTVRGTSGEPLPFAGIYLQNTSHGTSTNQQGNYSLDLERGTHVLVFSYVGFASQEIEVTLRPGERRILNVELSLQATEIGTAEIVADTRDKAREIMREVRDRRAGFADAVASYTCETYNRRTLMREPRDWDELLATGMDLSTLDSAGLDIEQPEYMLIEELVSTTQYRAPGRYQEYVQAMQEFKEGDIPEEPLREASASSPYSYGIESIVPTARESRNEYLVYEDLLSCAFDFYRNTFSYEGVVNRPLTSPIASGSALLHRYDYGGVVFEGTRKLYRILVKPLSAGEALFEGTLLVDASTYALARVDLAINPASMGLCNTFHVVQRYQELEEGLWLPVSRELEYTFREGRNTVVGRVVLEHSDYQINIPLPDTFSATEVRRFDPKAFDRDSTFWVGQRPAELRAEDMAFMMASDSVRNYLESDEWLLRQDSVYNVVDIWTPLVGYGYRNRAKGIELYVEGLLAQVNPFGIGGYRHRLPAQISYEFDNGLYLETNSFIDYGFTNKDIKGRVDIGLTYVPEKFVRTRLVYGDYYAMINNFASIEQVFSRSNFVRTTEYGIAQRMELVNGLFAELTLSYQDQRALVGLQLADWSENLFGDLNTPVDFARYKKSEIELRVQYNIRQKYQIKKGRKLILGSDYPELYLTYRKGVPNLLGSEVDYDYVELGATHEVDLLRYGNSRWRVQLGGYLNKRNLRVLEYRYFRGSDRYFFSDPLLSLQLLGPTLNTPDEWLQASYIHHFDGSILGKVPLINRLKLQLAAGGGILSIPDSDFHHGELFAGLERNFRIKGQLFRLGYYAVTADNTFDSSNLIYKVGISFYDGFRRKWDY